MATMQDIIKNQLHEVVCTCVIDAQVQTVEY